MNAIDGSIGEPVGRLYVAEYFPPESKAKMQALVGNLLAALSQRIDALDWMTPETKTRAHEKLATFIVKVGYPDHWKDYSALVIKPDDPIGNPRRAAQWWWDYQVARIDKPVDRSEWGMTPQEINAYYNPLNNEIVFPAAILQPPFFDPNADAAVNYGAIGAVIGHEIGHGFDDQGRKFGPDGAMSDWWTAKDAQVFELRKDKLIKEFSAFEALPGLKVNGANTIGENIGDLGGLNMAHEAYLISLKGQPAPGDRRTDRRSALLPGLRAGVAREVSRRLAARDRDVRRAQPVTLPRERSAAQHRCLVPGVRCHARREAVPGARGARAHLVAERAHRRGPSAAAVPVPQKGLTTASTTIAIRNSTGTSL